MARRILDHMAPASPKGLTATEYSDQSKLRVLLGDEVLERARGRVVLDFGCGRGGEVVELAVAGAEKVIGLDIQERFFDHGRALAEREGVSHRIEFVANWEKPVDLIISLDSFEHFGNVDRVLAEMYRLLKPGGRVMASFGPTWFHPLGGHFFSVFPWAHLIFTEASLIRWRSQFRNDGATRFSEVAGGLNQMTICQFEKHVERSPLVLERLESVPIRRLRWIASRATREFTTAVVRATMRRSCHAPASSV